MGRLFVILIAIGLFICWRRWRKLRTTQERRDFIYKGIVFGLIALIIGLAVFGRIDVLGAIFATLLLSIKFILSALIRYFPFIARIYGVTGGFGMGRKRTLKTEWVKVQVDFSTGRISGAVIKGQFENMELDELDQSQLESLLAECGNDAKSSYLIQTYMAQRFGQQQGGSGSTGGSAPSKGGMSHEEALEILGLEGNPDEKEIKTAHKKLMQKLHPDRGGNDFLASLLNRARDHLLDNK